MRYILLLTLAFFSVGAQAEDLPKGKGTVSGLVLDSKSQEPIEFATVTLLGEDSTLLNGTLTDAAGAFKFEDIEDGAYIIKADFIGYQSVHRNIAIGPDNRKIDLGNVALEAAFDLEGVEVVGEQAAFQLKIDKKVYDPDKNPINAGGTGLDVLRNVPSIEVDPDDNISLRGDQNVNILIDGRPVAMSVSQLLKTIPASSIDEVEIITNPSAKYDPEGTSGIINIKLKKNQNKGVNGNVNLSGGYGQFEKGNGSLSLNYMSEKINISSSLSSYVGRFGFNGSAERNIFGDTISGLMSDDWGYSGSLSPFATLSLDYFPSEKNTLYVGVNGGYSDGSDRRNIDYEFLENGVLQSSSERNGYGTNNGYNYQLNGGWQRKGSKDGHTFDLDTRYSFSSRTSNEDLDEFFFDANGTPLGNSAEQITVNRSNTNLLNIRADYVNPLTDSLKLETGFHYTGRFNDGSFTSESYDWSLGEFVSDTALNNDFDYTQDVYAAYLILGAQFKKWAVQGGLRAEQTLTLSELITTNETFNNDYFALFPSVHLTLGSNPYSQWQLSYSRRLNRPEVEELNPFTSYQDPYTLQSGNPFLLPEFIHVIEGSHLWIKEKFTWNTTLYHRMITDQKRRYVELLPGGVSFVSYDNLASSTLSGIESIFSYTPNKKMRHSLTLNYWYNSVDDPDVILGSNSSVNNGYSANLTSTFMLNKGLTIQLSGNYRGKMQVVQGIIEPAGGVDLAFSKKILKDRGSISVRVQDVFKTRSFNFIGDQLNGYNFNAYRLWESRQYWVSFNYFFGKMIRGKKHRELSDKSSSDNSIPSMQ